MGGDRIRLEGMIFYGMHGVDPAEKALGQRFVVDLEVERDLRKGRSDDVNDTLNYAMLYRIARSVLEGPSKNLIEAWRKRSPGGWRRAGPGWRRSGCGCASRRCP